MASFPEFKWQPDLGAERTNQPLVTTVQFGDGYEQRVAESLNRVKVSYNLNFSRPASEALEIQQFLEDRAGLESFIWTTPLGEQKMWVCRQWSGPTQQQRGLYVVAASFEEVFEN